jgi:hypothetical protein
MKKTRVLLPMIFSIVLVHGASFASQSDQAQEETSSQSGEKSANHSSPEGSNDTQVRGQKDQIGRYSNENQKGVLAAKDGTLKRRLSASHAEPLPSRQLRSGKMPAPDNLGTETPRDTLDSHPISLTMPSRVPNKPVKHPSMLLPPPAAALNGQQFKNSRDPGAHLATSGGPANSRRGTAVVNGSDLKPKP